MPKTSLPVRIATFAAGLAVATVFTAPYFLLRDQLQAYALLGYLGLFLSCMLANASVFLPASSTMFVMAASLVLNPWLSILAGGLGTAVGEQTSYICGYVGSRSLDGNDPRVTRIRSWLSKRAFLTVFLFAFVPLPLFDVAGVAAGMTRMTWWRFALAAALGKLLKFALAVAVLLRVVPWYIDTFPFIGSLVEAALNTLGVRPLP